VVCASSQNILVVIKSKYKESYFFLILVALKYGTLFSQKIMLLLVITLLVKMNMEVGVQPGRIKLKKR